MIYLKQSTAKTLRFGPFLDEDDGKTVEGSLTITQPDVRLSKNGGAFAQKSAAGTASYDEKGFYSVSLSTTDTATLGPLMVNIHESGALPVWREFCVVGANTYDSLFGTDRFNANVTYIGGTAVPATSGKLHVLDDEGNAIANETKQDIIDGNVDTLITNVPDVISLANINSEVDDALADYNGPTHAEMTAEHDVLEGEHVVINSNINDNETKIDAVQSDVTNIDAKTTNLPADPASETNVDATETKVDTLLSDVILSKYLDGFVYYDASSGSTGTTLGTHGTPDNQVNSVADAITLADALGTKKIMITGLWTEVANRVGYTFESSSFDNGYYKQETYSTTNCTFRNIEMESNTEAVSSDNLYDTINSDGNDVSMDGVAVNCILPARLYLNSKLHIYDSTFMASSDINWHDKAADLWTVNLGASNLDFKEMTSSSASGMIHLATNTNIVIDANCTAGWIALSGSIGTLTDNSTGTSVNNGTIPKIVDTELTAEHGASAWQTATGFGDATEAKQDQIIADTEDIQTQIGTAGAGLTDVGGMSTAMKAEVEAECDDALLAYDSANGVATQSSVDSIQNNTRFGVSIPTYFLIPTSAENVYKMSVNFRDNTGAMEDPDSNDIGLDLDTADGTDKNGILYKEFALSNVLDASGISGHKKLERTDVGRYFCYIKIASSETENQLIYNFALDESSVRQYYNRSNQMLESIPGSTTLADNAVNKDIIAESMKERDVSGTGAVSGSVYDDIMDNIDDNETKIDAVQSDVTNIDSKTTNLPADPASETNVDATETKVDALQVDVTAVKAKTDNLPSDPASETNVDATETKVDALDTKIGTPKAIDGGSADVSGMLKKMIDDNDGDDFNAEFDSLNKLQTAIVSGAPTNNVATGQTVNNGTVDSGSWSDTALDNGVKFQLSPNGAPLDVELTGNIGTDKVAEIIINGYWDGAANYCDVFAWNYSTASWDQLSEAATRMNNAGSDNNYFYILTSHHADTNGDFRIRWLSSSSNAAHDLYIDQMIVKSVSIGFTPEEYAEAVAIHDVSEHSDHNSLGFRVSLSLIDEYGITTSDTATSFTCSGLPATADYYNFHLVRIHDVTGDRYADSWILDMDNAGVVTLGRALPFIPDTSAEMYVMDGLVAPSEIQNGLATEANATSNTSAINTNVDATETKVDALQVDVTAVKAVTDVIPDSGAMSSIAQDATVAKEVQATTNKDSIITEVKANETKIDALQVDVTAIDSKTTNLPADPASETNVDATETKVDALQVDVTAVKAVTDVIPDSGAMTSIAQESTLSAGVGTLQGEHSALSGEHSALSGEHATIDANVSGNETKIDAVKVDTAAIDSKTTNLPADPASETNVDATEAKVDAVKAKTDNLPADPAGETSLSSTHGSGSWETAGGDATEAKQDTIIANQATIDANVSGNETKIDAVKVDTAAVKVQTDKMNFTGTDIHSIQKAKDNAIGLSTQEKADVNAEAKDVLFTDTVPEIADMDDVPVTPTIAQATMLHYMDRRNGAGAEDDLNQILNSAGNVILEEDIAATATEVTATKLRNPA